MPRMSRCRSSPRARSICSSSRAYRGFVLIASWVRCSSRRVGRIPIITMCAPSSRARVSAVLSCARTSVSYELGPVAGEAARRNVDLEVEASELRRERRVLDVLKDLGIAQCRVAVDVDEVELHLHARHGPLEVEPRAGEHHGEGVQTAMHLRAVSLPVLAGELTWRDFLTHGSPPPERCGNQDIERDERRTFEPVGLPVQHDKHRHEDGHHQHRDEQR